MRIGLVTGEYPPTQGGVGDFTREMALALADQGCHVRVVTDRRHGDAAIRAASRHYNVQRVTSPDWTWRDMWRVQTATSNLDLVNIQYQAAYVKPTRTYPRSTTEIGRLLIGSLLLAERTPESALRFCPT